MSQQTAVGNSPKRSVSRNSSLDRLTDYFKRYRHRDTDKENFLSTRDADISELAAPVFPPKQKKKVRFRNPLVEYMDEKLFQVFQVPPNMQASSQAVSEQPFSYGREGEESWMCIYDDKICSIC